MNTTLQKLIEIVKCHYWQCLYIFQLIDIVDLILVYIWHTLFVICLFGFFYFMNFIINYNQWHNHVNITLFILPNVLCVKLLDPIFKIKFYLNCTCKTVYLSGLNVWQSSNFPDNLSDILCLNEVQKLTILQNTVTLDFAPYKHLPRWWGRYDCITDSAFVE